MWVDISPRTEQLSLICGWYPNYPNMDIVELAERNRLVSTPIGVILSIV